MKKFTVILFAVLLLMFVISCNDDSKLDVKFRSVDWIEYQDYHNGVYFFPYVKDNFGKALSVFIVEHPELELVSFTSGEGTKMIGNGGYFVYFKKKPPEPVDQPKVKAEK